MKLSGGTCCIVQLNPILRLYLLYRIGEQFQNQEDGPNLGRIVLIGDFHCSAMATRCHLHDYQSDRACGTALGKLKSIFHRISNSQAFEGT